MKKENKIHVASRDTIRVTLLLSSSDIDTISLAVDNCGAIIRRLRAIVSDNTCCLFDHYSGYCSFPEMRCLSLVKNMINPTCLNVTHHKCIGNIPDTFNTWAYSIWTRCCTVQTISSRLYVDCFFCFNKPYWLYQLIHISLGQVFHLCPSSHIGQSMQYNSSLAHSTNP